MQMCLVISALLAFADLSRGQISLSKASNHLALRLLQKLHSEQKNQFFSPFSISTALAMVYNGAKGETKKEMRQVLAYEQAQIGDQEVNDQFSQLLDTLADQSEAYELSFANRIIAQKDSEILEPFEECLKNYFRSEIEMIDFNEDPEQVVKDINEWAAKQTKDKIKEVLSEPLDPMTRLLILNAVYFKGVFRHKFDKKLTKKEIFFNGGTEETKTELMKRVGRFNYTEIEELDCKLLEIPYSGEQISLYIVLPNEKQGLNDLYNKLKDMEPIDEAIAQLRVRQVSAAIPKFRKDFSYVLNKLFTDLGMKSVFSKKADLSAINGNKNLFVSKFIHKSFVDMSEEGTEAAAVSAVQISAKSLQINKPKLTQFRADHPFLFFIRNKINGIIFFCGQINQL